MKILLAYILICLCWFDHELLLPFSRWQARFTKDLWLWRLARVRGQRPTYSRGKTGRTLRCSWILSDSSSSDPLRRVILSFSTQGSFHQRKTKYSWMLLQRLVRTGHWFRRSICQVDREGASENGTQITYQKWIGNEKSHCFFQDMMSWS